MISLLFLVRILRQAQHERTRQTGALKIIVTITLLLLTITPAIGGVISVSSPRATAKHIPNTHTSTITYFPKVRVKLPDKTDIRAGSLTATVDTEALQKKSSDPIFQRAVFQSNVRIKRTRQRAQADQATLDIATNICTLSGQVLIKHVEKRGTKHVPITTRGDKATINLKTNEVTLEGTDGTEHERVETTIELGGREAS